MVAQLTKAPPADQDLISLPKAHLHMHFTGSMRPETLLELSQTQDIRVPAHLLEEDPLSVPADARGWFRFQRSYDAARSLVRSEEVMRRIVREAAEDDAAEGSKRLEIQIDPTSYAQWVGGITPALEIVLDEAKLSTQATGVEVGVIVSASRVRHPLEARVLARLAAQYAGDQTGEVIGFGLSNDERMGTTADFSNAFQIARKAGLVGVPHGGELLGPSSLREVVGHLAPERIGHGVRATEDPELLARLVDEGIAFEICPTSNVQLGVFSDPTQVPLRKFYEAGAKIALSADDPLLFRSRLVDQYALARDHLGFTNKELADMASSSIDVSLASEASKQIWKQEIGAWLTEKGLE